jgi:cytoskeleton protein RodZ
LTGSAPFLIIPHSLQMLEIGERFKKARESQNVSIDRIAAETRISTRFLLAIENEQFDILPGGIFNRGFIRTYAERVGIDPEEAIRSYERFARVVEPEQPRQEAPRVAGKTTKIPVYYIAIAGLLILFIAFYIWTRPSEPSISTAVAASPAASETKVGPTEASASESVDLGELQASADQAPSEPTAPTMLAPNAVSVATPAVHPPQAVTPAAPATSVQSAALNAPIVIELQVREESWFQLSADGNSVASGEVLAVGTVRRYTANSSMDLSVGNAAGISLRVNGQPVSSLGRNGQVRKLTITPNTSAASLAVKAAE